MSNGTAEKPANTVKKSTSKSRKPAGRVTKSTTTIKASKAMAKTSGAVTLTELLSSDTARLPKSYDEDIEEYLAGLFSRYSDSVAQLATGRAAAAAVHNQLGTIKALSAGILSTLDQYLSGHTFEAFQTFSNAIDHVRPQLQSLVLPLEILLGVHEVMPRQRYGDLYRLRTGPMTQLSRRDLFHIPFEKRQLVASQRYSIPGLPSLYLASSLWIAWEELGRPALASLHAARFEGRGNLRVLDFGWSPSAGLSTFGDDDAELYRPFAEGQAVIWPLIATCSLVRRHPGAPFVPEYIIPQFLLQWVQTEKDVDGIRYFSTKLTAMNRAANRAFNFVFPVRNKAARGICGGLQNAFALTPPMSWPMLQSWQPRIMGASLPVAGKIDLAEQFPVAYSDTEFFSLEHKLKSVRAEAIG
jgi:hypothetical protein